MDFIKTVEDFEKALKDGVSVVPLLIGIMKNCTVTTQTK